MDGKREVEEIFSPFIVDDSKPLFDGGMNISSIKFAEIILQLEEKFNIDIDVDEIYSKKSTDEVAAYIKSLGGQ